MSIPNNPLVELVIQDIISANSTKADKPFFNTSFDRESIANFYTIDFSSPLACHYFKEWKNSSIKDNTGLPLDNLMSKQK